MEENTKMVLNGSPPTSHTFPIMPRAAYPSRTKINPTAMTSATHLNLPSVSPYAAHLTHTTMPAIEWLKRKRLNWERKQSIGKLETWITSPTQVTTSLKLSKAGEEYARCSTNLNHSTPTIQTTG